MSELIIGPASPEELAELPGIELRAGSLFSPTDLPPSLAVEATDLSVFAEAQQDGRVLVARYSVVMERDRGKHDANADRESTRVDRVVGFAHIIWIDSCPHLEELDVDPDFGRRGIGRGLVQATLRWAREKECDAVTLSTFREIPWNGPFYSRMGFEAIEDRDLTESFRKLRKHEAELGLDIERRIIMRRDLSEGA